MGSLNILYIFYKKTNCKTKLLYNVSPLFDKIKKKLLTTLSPNLLDHIPQIALCGHHHNFFLVYQKSIKQKKSLVQ